MIKVFGQYGVEAMSLAADPDSVLLTDDAVQGEAATSLFSARRTWMQPFLIFSVQKAKLSQEQYAEAVAKLVGMRYQGTTFDGSTVLQAAKLAGYNTARWPFKQVADCFSIVGTPTNALIQVALNFHLLLLREPVLPQQSGHLLGALFEALWQNPAARRPLLQLRRRSSDVFGVNVIAESQFNMCFDLWYSEHQSDVI